LREKNWKAACSMRGLAVILSEFQVIPAPTSSLMTRAQEIRYLSVAKGRKSNLMS